jgi:hypothetical protein
MYMALGFIPSTVKTKQNKTKTQTNQCKKGWWSGSNGRTPT